MPYIGNQTSCWAASPIAPFEFAVAQGFDAFEWFPDKKPMAGWDESDLDTPTRQRIREMARARSMRLSVHARYEANPLEPHSRELLELDLALAKDLGAALLNIHFFEERGVVAFVDSILWLLESSTEAGLQLTIENTPHHSPEIFNELFELLQHRSGRGGAAAGMCLDIGHANLAAATRNDYIGFLDRLKPTVPIWHVHAHENWGDADSHLPLFTGPATRDNSGIRALVERLKARNFSGSIVLEQWPNPPSLLTTARDQLLAIWGTSHPTLPVPHDIGVPAERALTHEPATSVLAQELVEGNRLARSWREKLELIRRVLSRHQHGLTTADLACVAIYLRFLSAGEIPCAEDGRHFRPSHHAQLASEIVDRLSRLATDETHQALLRRIYPALPSFDHAFRRPEPLTRIRDIAHRNDIGADLKREIKTTLQNKLHRCAGPEDLRTSAALLQRITEPGAEYSREFVEQFRIFHDELREFFNTAPLKQRLEHLATIEPNLREPIQRFLTENNDRDLGTRLSALRALTALRQVLLPVDAMQSDAPSQVRVLADIALEDSAFVLLSQIVNDFETLDFRSSFTQRGAALILALGNVSLSGVLPSESLAIAAELRAWGELVTSDWRITCLRYRASILRARRLAQEHAQMIVALFSPVVEQLGPSLGVPEHAIRVFSEADIRSHLVFQIAKLTDALLSAIRTELGLSPWDTVVPGATQGKVTVMPELRPDSHASSEPIIALVEKLEGDEEIPQAVTALVVRHQIPCLSHISVRARQAGVVVVACEEANEFNRIAQQEGHWISLQATVDGVVWEARPRDVADVRSSEKVSIAPGPVRLETSRDWLSMHEAHSDNAGPKAAGARRLAELSREADASFRTPRGLVIPFGIMERALSAAPELSKEYARLVRQVDQGDRTARAETLRQLSELVRQLAVPQAIRRQLETDFGKGHPLVVRSSANCEDLDGLASAGLYGSVINVLPDQIDSAVRTVWASLWTPRAAESRREASIPHSDAHMAVLVQELVSPEFSFVLHTTDPVSRRPNELYAEVVAGLGETLVSMSESGNPYQLRGNKNDGSVKVLAFANISHARRAASRSGVQRQTIDYSQVRLSRNPSELETLGRTLTRIGAFVESRLGAPQDIEGACAGGQVFLVQTRPQQGLQSVRPA